MSWFERLTNGLQKTRKKLVNNLEQTISRYRTVKPGLWDEIEELLVTADIGARTAMTVTESLKERVTERGIQDPDQVIELLKEELRRRLEGAEGRICLRDDGQPTVILMMGVNGSGKTTTIAKLGKKFKALGKEVVLAASDTFRAAAIEQLEEWGNRIDAPVIKHDLGADPSAVAYDALEHTLTKKAPVLLIDTAGRLQTKHNLMQELKKINKVIEKRLGRPVDERLLTIDSTNGQNGISQARKFNEALQLSGIILTKLDSTSKGGVIFPIIDEIKVKIKYIGVGEKEEDLHEFDKDQFIEALFG